VKQSPTEREIFKCLSIVFPLQFYLWSDLTKNATIENPDAEATALAVREQLNLIVQDPAFRSSKRSVQFLKYVVEKTLEGQAEQIKERTIGVDVFGRKPSYDTNEDHVVRTAAGELRKRLVIYYSNEKHRTELRMSLVPGSYIQWVIA
jgi:hypothetical protein